MLPYGEEDLAGWPLRFEDLEPHYREVLSYVPIAGRSDGLAGRYPCPVELLPLPADPVCAALLERLERRKTVLASRGVEVGAARLAVRPPPPNVSNAHSGCVGCGRCLDGCPYGHIYDAATTLDALTAVGSIDYRPGCLVERVEEHGEGVWVLLRAADGSKQRLHARRVMLAAGAVSSVAILQRSSMVSDELTIRDSQTVFLPALWLGPSGARSAVPFHTLAQVFVRLGASSDTDRAAQVQLYGYNDGLEQRIAALRPGLFKVAKHPLRRALPHLVMAIAYLHSDLSHGVRIRTRETIRLEPRHNQRTAPAVRRLLRRLHGATRSAGLVTLGRAGHVGGPGEGYHCGAALPMRVSPRWGESDLLGRPYGSDRVHLVDATCFPNVPAGPVTFTIMANADRISAAAIALDRRTIRARSLQGRP